MDFCKDVVSRPMSEYCWGHNVIASTPTKKQGAQKKQGATGITTVAPYVAGQWGRGNNRLPG